MCIKRNNNKTNNYNNRVNKKTNDNKDVGCKEVSNTDA